MTLHQQNELGGLFLAVIAGIFMFGAIGYWYENARKKNHTVRAKPTLSPLDRIALIRCKLDILKLKADDYNWQCHTPQDVKIQLEATLVEIEELVK